MVPHLMIATLDRTGLQYQDPLSPVVYISNKIMGIKIMANLLIILFNSVNIFNFENKCGNKNVHLLNIQY